MDAGRGQKEGGEWGGSHWGRCWERRDCEGGVKGERERWGEKGRGRKRWEEHLRRITLGSHAYRSTVSFIL